MLENIILQSTENEVTKFIIQNGASIIIGMCIAAGFYFMSTKTSKKQTSILEKISDMLEELTDLKMIQKKPDVVSAKDEPAPKKSIDKDAKYDEKVSKCKKLLEDERWVWRSDVKLIEKSGLTEDEFNNFVRKDEDVVKSKINDINGNRLFSLKSKLQKKS